MVGLASLQAAGALERRNWNLLDLASIYRGTDVTILKIFSRKIFGEKLVFFVQNSTVFW
jgi:hypothetical protein